MNQNKLPEKVDEASEEIHPDGWKRVVLMVSPEGEFYAVGGEPVLEGDGAPLTWPGFTWISDRILKQEGKIKKRNEMIAKYIARFSTSLVKLKNARLQIVVMRSEIKLLINEL